MQISCQSCPPSKKQDVPSATRSASARPVLVVRPYSYSTGAARTTRAHLLSVATVRASEKYAVHMRANQCTLINPPCAAACVVHVRWLVHSRSVRRQLQMRCLRATLRSAAHSACITASAVAAAVAAIAGEPSVDQRTPVRRVARSSRLCRCAASLTALLSRATQRRLERHGQSIPVARCSVVFD